MSSRLAILVPALFVAGVVAAQAQERGEREARLRERIRLLEIRAESARAAYVRVSRQRHADLTDTIVHGALVVVTQSEMRSRVGEASSAAWAHLRSALGADGALAVRDSYAVVSAPGAARGARGLSVLAFRPTADAREMKAALLFRLEQNLFRRLPRAVHGWLVPGALETLEPEDLRIAYVELVTAGAPAGRDCFHGRMQGCRAYFGLPGPYDSLEMWYSPAEQVRRGQAAGERLRRREAERWNAAFEPCLTAGDAAACRTILRAAATIRPPASHRARRSLQQLALELGGAGAFGRLLTGQDTSVEHRLAAAAGVPINALLGHWRTAVIARSEDRPPLTRATVWVAVVWVALFGAIAARSSRWGRL